MKKTKKKINRNRRIVLALLMLLISGIALTTATYAWFSANTVVTATGIDVKVTASAGISISADAVNFGKTTSMDQVVSFAQNTEDTFDSTLQLPEELSPVSTGGVVGANSKFSFFKGTLGENDVVLLETNNESNTFLTTEGKTDFTGGDYIAFDVYIRSSIDQNIKLNSNSKIGVIDGGANTASLESALRVGFLPLGTTTDTGADTAQKSAYDLNDVQSDWSIWNPYPALHHTATLAGYAEGESELSKGYYGAISDTKSVVAYSSLGEAVTVADGEEAPADSHYVKFLHKDFENTPAYYSLIDSSNTHYLPAASADTILPSSNLLAVKAGVTKVRIYVWLEGNDVDCVDAISISDGLTVNIGFEVA